MQKFGRQIRPFALFLPAFFTASCMGPTVSTPDALRSYKNAKPCCVSFSTAQREHLQFGTVTPFQIDQKDQAFDFGRDGISFFKLFEIPDETKPFKCKVGSHSAGDGRVLTVFFPKVALITDSFSILRDEASDGARGVDPTWTKQGGVGVDIAVTPEQHVKYLAVHTARDYIGDGRDVQLSPVETGLGVGYAVIKESGKVHLLGSPVSAANNMDIFCSVGT